MLVRPETVVRWHLSWLLRPSARSGGAAVLVVQPAQDGDCDHGLLYMRTRRRNCRRSQRCALADALVRPRAVKVADVLRQHAPEVSLAEDEDVIEALPPDAAQEPLADGVGPRCADR